MNRSLRPVFSVLLLAGCGDNPIGPGGGPGASAPIAIGDTVDVELSADAPERSFSFRTADGDSLALFLQGIEGFIQIVVTDSAQDVDLRHEFTEPNGKPLLATFAPLTLEGNTTYLIRAQASSSASARARLFLYRRRAAPESLQPTIETGAAVEGEVLQTSADLDVFELSGQAGTELIAYLQPLDGQPHNFVGLSVQDPASGEPLAGVTNFQTSSDLELLPTARFTLPHDGVYRVVVRGEGGYVLDGRTDAGRYRFMIRPVVRAPETLPGVIPPGDTLAGEAIDYVGDVDRFAFTAAAGELYNVFLQNLAPAADHALVLQVLGPDGTARVGVLSEGDNAGLFTRSTGRIALPEAGQYTLEVTGSDIVPTRGAYRLFLYRVDSLPEQSPAGIALGEAVTGETLDLPGDLDVYTVTIPEAMIGNVLVSKPASVPDRPRVEVVDGDGNSIAFGFTPDGSSGPGEVRGLTGAFDVAPGTLRLRVETLDPAVSQVAYGLQAFGARVGPETAAADITIGTTVSNEAIDVPGDIDRFRFDGTEGRLVTIQLQGMGAPGGENAFFQALLNVGGFFRCAISPVADPAPGATTRLIVLPEDRGYELHVSAGSAGGSFEEQGDYRLALLPVTPSPENLPATVAGAATITGEAIDSLGDVDRFTVTATANSDQVVFVNAPYSIQAELLEPTGDRRQRSAFLGGARRALGRFRIPASGQLRLQFYEATVQPCPSSFASTGPYEFGLEPIDRAPETIGTTPSRNVVVSGEAVDEIGDIDEFTFAGAAGEVIQVFFNTPFGMFPPALLEVVAPSGDVLGSVSSGNAAPELDDQTTGPITLPVAGTYTVRVSGDIESTSNSGYEFMIAD